MARLSIRRVGRVAIPLLILLLLLVRALTGGGGGAGSGRMIDAEGRRLFVADGDTLRIGDETIRLAGLDAVERDQFCLDGQGASWSCGQSALSALADLAGRGGLRCVGREHDRYGRMIARCSVTGVADVGAAMVQAGWAVADDGTYAAQARTARDARRGIWAGTFEAPAMWRDRNRIVPKSVRRGDAG